MADIHDALIRTFRKKKLRGGLKETKSPMPTYRPDIFAEKLSTEGVIVEQLAVEAEIQTTLFSEHTSHQLLKLDEFVRHQQRRRVSVRGYLLIPRGRTVRSHARSLLDSLFPHGTAIRIVDAA